MSYVILQGEPSSVEDYFQIESHNWKELVNKAIIMSWKINDKLLLSISFIHYKHVLPRNAQWLDIFKIYNKPQFSIVCETFGQTMCSEILLDTLKNIYETRPPLSCSVLWLIKNITEVKTKQLSTELCYCNTYINILYYLVSIPYIAAIGISIMRIISNIFFFNILNEMYYKYYITSLALCIIFSVLSIYVLIHPVLNWLCHTEWYIEGPQQLFIILFFSLSFLILYKLVITLNMVLYHNPYILVFSCSCGSAISFYIIEIISSNEYEEYTMWAHCILVCISIYVFALSEDKKDNTILKYVHSYLFENFNFPFIYFCTIVLIIILILSYFVIFAFFKFIEWNMDTNHWLYPFLRL